MWRARRLARLEQAEVSDMMPVPECDEVEQDQPIMQLPPHDFDLRAQGEVAACSGGNSSALGFFAGNRAALSRRNFHVYNLSTGSARRSFQIILNLLLARGRGGLASLPGGAILSLVTIFLGCGFAAKYREGGGVFSVPLQWMLGLRRLRQDAIWLELLPATADRAGDAACIANFQRQLRSHGLAGRYCLLYQEETKQEHELGSLRCIGLARRELRARLAGPNVLLNLAYSIHPPFLLEFERRIFCDLDPSEVFYWMTKLEMGQSSHHEFWTIGLNAGAKDCGLPKSSLPWRTFYPLVDTRFFQAQPRKLSRPQFTTIGQWYWSGSVEVNGEFPDLSKKERFAPYLDLPSRVPEAEWELAMHINPDDPETKRLAKLGWRLVDPHRVARTPAKYRRYLASAMAEFTAIKGVDVSWRTGWVSDRAAAFLATGRPVITEDTGAAKYLPPESGFCFVRNAEEAMAAARRVLRDWPRLSRQARTCAVEVFDSAKNLRRILSL